MKIRVHLICTLSFYTVEMYDWIYFLPNWPKISFGILKINLVSIWTHHSVHRIESACLTIFFYFKSFKWKISENWKKSGGRARRMSLGIKVCKLDRESGDPCSKKQTMAKSMCREKYDERDYEKEYKIPKTVTSRSTQVDQSNIIGLSFFSNEHVRFTSMEHK